MFKLFFLLIIALFIINTPKDITWKEGERLTWNDFKGQPDLNSDAAAITASGISFSYSIKQSTTSTTFTTTIEAHFYPEHSWHKKEVNDHLLEHEQLHFDITELNVRKLKKRLSKITETDDLDAILLEEQVRANRELAEMQDKYDSDSDYSINENNQKNWKRYVESELASLYEFRSK